MKRVPQHRTKPPVQILPGRYLASDFPANQYSNDSIDGEIKYEFNVANIPAEPEEPPPSPTHLIKFLVLGKSHTLKTNIIKRFVRHDYQYDQGQETKPEKDVSVIHEYYKKDLTLSNNHVQDNAKAHSDSKNVCVRLQIWNIADINNEANIQYLSTRQQKLQIFQNVAAAIIIHEVTDAFDIYNDQEHNNFHSNPYSSYLADEIHKHKLFLESMQKNTTCTNNQKNETLTYPIFLFLHFPSPDDENSNMKQKQQQKQSSNTRNSNTTYPNSITSQTQTWIRMGRFIDHICKSLNVQEWFLISKPFWMTNKVNEMGTAPLFPRDYIHDSFLNILRLVLSERQRKLQKLHKKP